ncbi:MAG: dephospho-CoA kinase [Mariprofundus sp.]
MNIPRIGLTGGIGSGKSTAAGIFAAQGIAVLDLDRVGHDVVSAGSDGLKLVVETFGAKMLRPDGSLNRKLLGQHCFADADETARLNAIMHPLIWQAEEAWLVQQQGDYAMIEASVLLESGAAQRMDAVVVILADTELRRERVLIRGDQSSAEFDAIIARQCDDNKRREAADFMVYNNGSLDELQQQVFEVHRMLKGREYATN